MPFQGTKFLARHPIPQDGCIIPKAYEKLATIGAESYRFNPRRMLFKGTELLACRHIPQDGRVVLAIRDHLATIWAERGREDRAAKGAKPLTRGCVPEDCGLIIRPR